MFLGWLDLIIFIRKLPLTGIYVLMFIDIFYTFCRLFFLSLLLVIAFGLAFYMSFNEPLLSVSNMERHSGLPCMSYKPGRCQTDTMFQQMWGSKQYWFLHHSEALVSVSQ